MAYRSRAHRHPAHPPPPARAPPRPGERGVAVWDAATGQLGALLSSPVLDVRLLTALQVLQVHTKAPSRARNRTTAHTVTVRHVTRGPTGAIHTKLRQKRVCRTSLECLRSLKLSQKLKKRKTKQTKSATKGPEERTFTRRFITQILVLRGACQ